MVPPLVGVAVNVTLWFGQMEVSFEVMLTVGVTVGFTVTVMAFEVAGLPVTPPRFEVITQVTVCPLIRLDVIKVAPVPTLLPFTSH